MMPPAKKKTCFNCHCITVTIFAAIGVIIMIAGFGVYDPSDDATIQGEAGGFIAGFGAMIFGMALMVGTCKGADPDDGVNA
mmetsp:Transcript_13504/g.12105  ORF Transcript_13504/g.12105 Transcript_13504/m.12105 type:complete len:81 (+) Transcript_13504:167-409(+)